VTPEMKFFITIVFAFAAQTGISQYKEVPLTNGERRNGVLLHYQIADTYASAHLYILPGNRFRFENYTCLTNTYSEGTYREAENEIILTSTLQKGTLPLQIECQKRAPGDSLVKRIARLQDADGRVVNDGFVHINDDSTSCIFGDNLCTKELNSIDSIKIVLSGGVSSKWIKVNPGKEIIQIRILARGELKKYVIYNGRYRKDGTMLEPIFE
jgi:hypothetical protein